MDSNASRTSVSAVTSSQIASGLVPSTPTRIASYTNGRVRSGSTSSENGNSGTQVALSSRRSSKARPVSIIDDALFNSAASPTSLFDKRRSTQSLVAIAGDGSMIPRPVSPTARGNANGSVSFRAAGESIAEEVDGDWSMRDESQDYSFAGKDSPTRTRSRIPISSVGHARVLAEEMGPFDSPGRLSVTLEDLGNVSPSHSARYSLPATPSTPNGHRRSMIFSGVTGGTTRVLSDLQAGVEHAKKALENTKSQLRASQRTVAALTRQTEDLKEGRDRLRLENEGLNNVVARKERLLQEVLERARKAEAEASALKANLKTTASEAKKSLRDMETTVAEATTTSMKAEREYTALKESLSSMNSHWQREVQSLKAEVKKKEDQWAKEREDMTLKYKSVLKLQQSVSAEKSRLESIKMEKKENGIEFERHFRKELENLRAEFSDNAQQSSKAAIEADYVASELARIRHLMRVTSDSQT